MCGTDTARGGTQPGRGRTLARAFGCARVVYNDGLGTGEDANAGGAAFSEGGGVGRRGGVAGGAERGGWLEGVAVVLVEPASPAAAAPAATTEGRSRGGEKAARASGAGLRVGSPGSGWGPRH